MRKAVAEGNSTENWDSPKHYADVATASFIGVLIIVGVGTNGTVCYVYAKLFRNRSVIKRPFQSFILTMSSVDLFSCLVGFPLDMVILLVPEVPDSKALCVITVFIFGVTITTDILMLVAVNTIRYYSVMHPLKTMPRRCFFMLPVLTLVVSCSTTLPFAVISDRKVVSIARDYYTFECRRFENTRGLDVAPHATFCFIVLCFLIWQDTTLARKLKSLTGGSGFLAKMRPPVSGISHLAINTDAPFSPHTTFTACKAAPSAVPRIEELAAKDDFPRTLSTESIGSSADAICRSVDPTSSQLEPLAAPRARGRQEHEENVSAHQSLSSVWTRVAETSGPECPCDDCLTPHRVDSNTCSDSSRKDASYARTWEKRSPLPRRYQCAWQAQTSVRQCEAVLAHEPRAFPEWPGPSPAPLGPPRWWRMRKLQVTTQDRTLLTLRLVTALFALLYLPYFVYMFLCANYIWDFPPSRLGISAKGVTKRGYYILSAANAFLYNHFNRGFRSEVKSILRSMKRHLCLQWRNQLTH